MRGTTAIEYAIIAAFLSIIVVTAVNLLGQNVKSQFFDKLAAVIVQ
ncbi:MAG TPA: Flp family type IVb pilin [Rhizomicrobium sp.]